MRLTLRNLLRYLDQSGMRSIERSRLEALVDESEKADAWIKKIDSLRHSNKVVAPPIDFNQPECIHVASYLDGTLSEQVTIDFEKSTMQSDLLLAEVASCHEIREAIRSESHPTIPLELRQSIYDVGRGHVNYARSRDDEHESTMEDSVAELASTMEDLPYVDGNPDDPDPIGGYMDGAEHHEDDLDESVSLDDLSKRGRKRAKLVIAGLVAIAAGLLGLTYWLGVQAGKDPNQISENQQNDQNVDGDNGAVEGNNTAPKTALEDNALDNEKTTNDSSSDEGENGNDSNPNQPIENELAIAIGPVADVRDPTEFDPSQLPERPRLPSRELFGELLPHIPVAVAKLVDSNPTLLRLNNASYTPLITNEAMKENDTFMVLPGTTSEFELDGLIMIRAEGPASFSIERKDPASLANVLEIDFGRLTVTSLNSDVDLLVERSERTYLLNFPVQDTAVQLHFLRFLEQGTDPRETPPVDTEFIVVEKGRAELFENGKSTMLQGTQGMFRSVSTNPTHTHPPSTGFIDLPIARKRNYDLRLKDTVKKNFTDLSEQLASESTLTPFLSTLKSDVRQERRFAAIAWLATTGNFSYLIDFLKDEKNRNNWRSVVESVRASIQNNPQNAQKLFDALALAGEEDQKTMYQLILGFTTKELESGQDEKLVELLNHDQLSIRILAIERLRHITNGIAYGYTPHADRVVRRRIIDRQWKKALKKQEIRYQSPQNVPVPKFIVPGTDPAVQNGSGIN